MKIEDLLVDFDEMGFAPTTLCENPEGYACLWKNQLGAAVSRLKLELALAKAFNDEQSAEFQRICYKYHKQKTENHDLRVISKEAQTAVKDFAKKVKARAARCYGGDVAKIICDEVNNVLKEYEE